MERDRDLKQLPFRIPGHKHDVETFPQGGAPPLIKSDPLICLRIRPSRFFVDSEPARPFLERAWSRGAQTAAVAQTQSSYCLPEGRLRPTASGVSCQRLVRNVPETVTRALIPVNQVMDVSGLRLFALHTFCLDDGHLL